MKRNMKVRFIEPVGRITSNVGIWEGTCPCGGKYHRAEVNKQEYPGATDATELLPEPYTVTEGDGTTCQYCGAPAPAGLWMGGGSGTLWSNGKDKPQPGDMYWASWYHQDGRCVLGKWDNCNDPRGHLMVVLPNGHTWDIDGRASNCDMKDERTHRCWVRHGEPPNITVDKGGHTCHAGAGSIIGGEWHGFLRNGVLEEC